MTKREFNIVRLEERIAPTGKPAVIPSVNPDPAITGGAEHGLQGLTNNHSGDANFLRHGGAPSSP